MLVHLALSRPIHRMGARFAQPAMLATVRLTPRHPPSSRTIMVRSAPRAITAPRERTSHSNAHLAPSIPSKDKRPSRTASFASLAPSRTNGARQAAKSAASSPTHAKAWTSVSVSVKTEPTLQRSQAAVARATSITWMRTSSQRVTTVT